MGKFRSTSFAVATCGLCLFVICLGTPVSAEEVPFPPESLEALLDEAYPENLIFGKTYCLDAVPPTEADIAEHRKELPEIPPSFLETGIRWMERIMKPEALPSQIGRRSLYSADGPLVFPPVVALNNYRGTWAKDLRKAVGRSVKLPTGEVMAYPGVNPEWKGKDIFLTKRTTRDASVLVWEDGGYVEFTVIFRNKPKKKGHELIREVLQRFTRIPDQALTQLDMSEVTRDEKVWTGHIYCGIRHADVDDVELIRFLENYNDWWGDMRVVADDRFVFISIREVIQAVKNPFPTSDRF